MIVTILAGMEKQTSAGPGCFGVDYEALALNRLNDPAVRAEIERAMLKVEGVTSATVETNAGSRPDPISVRVTITSRPVTFIGDPGPWLHRTRSGAWIVKGRGPTCRYSTYALAARAAKARRR